MDLYVSGALEIILLGLLILLCMVFETYIAPAIVAGVFSIIQMWIIKYIRKIRRYAEE